MNFNIETDVGSLQKICIITLVSLIEGRTHNFEGFLYFIDIAM